MIDPALFTLREIIQLLPGKKPPLYRRPRKGLEGVICNCGLKPNGEHYTKCSMSVRLKALNAPLPGDKQTPLFTEKQKSEINSIIERKDIDNTLKVWLLESYYN